MVGGALVRSSTKSTKVFIKTLLSHKKSFASKAKILFSFFQVVSLMSRTYSIEYPPEYKNFLRKAFDWMGLNIVTEIECYQKFNFLSKLCIAVFGPLVIAALIFFVIFLSTMVIKTAEKKRKRMHKALQLFIMMTFAMVSERSERSLKESCCAERKKKKISSITKLT